jgi:hypothetical protein
MDRRAELDQAMENSPRSRKLNEVAGSRPCNLGRGPDCKFLNKELCRCRSEDSDDSDEPAEAVSRSLLAIAATADMRREFAGSDVDSDDEEGDLVDSIDYNVLKGCTTCQKKFT